MALTTEGVGEEVDSTTGCCGFTTSSCTGPGLLFDALDVVGSTDFASAFDSGFGVDSLSTTVALSLEDDVVAGTDVEVDSVGVASVKGCSEGFAGGGFALGFGGGAFFGFSFGFGFGIGFGLIVGGDFTSRTEGGRLLGFKGGNLPLGLTGGGNFFFSLSVGFGDNGGGLALGLMGGGFDLGLIEGGLDFGKEGGDFGLGFGLIGGGDLGLTFGLIGGGNFDEVSGELDVGDAGVTAVGCNSSAFSFF